MKTLDLNKQEFLDLKKSFEWIDHNHFATVEMLPKDLGQLWLDPYFEERESLTHGHFQRLIFLYGLYKTNSLLKKNEEQIPYEDLEAFYSKWQLKIHLANLHGPGQTPLDLHLDKTPLFLFNRNSDPAIEKKWNRCSKMLMDLGLRNFSL